MTTLDKLQLLEQRIVKATILIRNLENKIDELNTEIEVLSVHNEELQRYADTFTADSKLIEESVTKALDHLDSIAGLDDIDLGTMLTEDLEAADMFTSGSALALDEVKLDDITP